jgi:VCBS repeat-containing protein
LPGPASAIDELNSQTVSFNVTVDKSALFEVQPAVAPNGTLSFKPKADANGVAIVTVIAVDSAATPAQSLPQVFTISINPVNDSPVFTAGPTVAVVEDSGAYSQPWATRIAPAAGLLLVPPTATDESSQVVDFVLVVDKPNLFSVQPTIDSNGRLQFTPNRDSFGTALVTVTAVDRGPSGALDQNTSAPQTLTITVAPANDLPIAVADTINANENTLLTLPAPGLLANDTDVDLPNDVLTAVAGNIQSSLGAKVTINANGSITYDASLVNSIQQMTTGQSVQDTFVYKIKDASGVESVPATVTVNVAGVNDAPIAVNDTYTVGVGQSQFLDVLINDSDIDSPIDAASIRVTSLPAFGTVVVNQTGVIQYSSGGGFRGVDTFRYTVRDGAGNVSNEAQVTVTVNNRPIANPDTATTFKNQPIDINVLANDSDLDGTLNPASVQIVVAPSPSGTATVLANGSIRFVPATNFSGSVTLSYIVSDDVGTVSNVANVDVRVQRSKWQNPRSALDVNADTFISPIDALLIINRLNDPTFERDLTKSNFVPPPFLDVNGDETVSAIDALLVINYLNTTRSAGGEGEGEGEGEANLSATTYAMMVTPQQMIATVGNQVVQEIQATLNESLLNTSTNSSVSNAGAAFVGWLDDDEEDEVVEGLFCSSDDVEKVVDAVDSFFETIGPHLS